MTAAACGIAGQGPFEFVVDTGANQSVISAELVASLGLPINPSSRRSTGSPG